MRIWVGSLTAAAIAAACLLAGASTAQAPPAPAAPAPPAGPVLAALPLAPGQPLPPAELEAFVDGVAAEAMSRDHIAGATVAVVQNGQVVLKKGYGLDRLRPARPVDPDRTLFRLGGVTASFTWIAALKEIEAGRMRLDAPVNVYLPLKNQIRDQGQRRPVRLRDLMSHTAGFEERTYGQLYERRPERIRPLDVYLRQERPRRVREPGVLPAYSNYGVALAGQALEQVSGKTSRALAERDIFMPLGLWRTTLREPYPAQEGLPAPMDPRLAADLSQAFGWTGEGFRPRPTEYMTQIAPALAGSSTAGDMSRYMLALLGGGTLDGVTIYSPQVARRLRAALQPPAPGVSGFTHGLMEYALPGGHRGYGHAGHTLSFHSNLVTVPALGLGVFVAANTETAGPFAAELPGRIVDRFYAPRVAPAPAPSDWLKQNGGAFAGRYLTTDRAYQGLEAFADLLKGQAQVKVSDDGYLLTPGPSGPRRWTPDPSASLAAPHVAFRAADGPETLVFQMQGGRAVRWFAPDGREAFQRSGLLSRTWFLAFLAVMTGLASIAAIASPFLRDRREFRQTTVQGRADAAQISGSILWLTSLVGFAIWTARAADPARLMYGWPGASLLIASSSAFVAAVMTALCLVLLPVVWRGGRRLDSWTGWRKARFTFTTLVFSLFAVVLALWGALEPWSR